MRLSISYLSRNRLLGKAMRRVRPQLESLFAALREVPVSEKYGDVVLWISDNPADHYQEIDKTQEHLSVHVGYPPDFSFEPRNDHDLLVLLLSCVEYFLSRSQLSKAEVEAIRDVISRWRSEAAAVS